MSPYSDIAGDTDTNAMFDMSSTCQFVVSVALDVLFAVEVVVSDIEEEFCDDKPCVEGEFAEVVEFEPLLPCVALAADAFADVDEEDPVMKCLLGDLGASFAVAAMEEEDPDLAGLAAAEAVGEVSLWPCF